MAGRAIDVRPSDPFPLVAYHWGSDTGTTEREAVEATRLHATDCMENMADKLSEYKRAFSSV